MAEPSTFRSRLDSVSYEYMQRLNRQSAKRDFATDGDNDNRNSRASGASTKSPVLQTWRLFTPTERRNLMIYILGIMLYKFGLKAFVGSVIALATNRYDYDARRTNTTPKTFQRVGLLVALNQTCQCIGSILIAPLTKRYPIKVVLTTAVLIFAFCSTILLIADGATGGRIKPLNWDEMHGEDDFSYYGTYETDGMIPIYCVSGIAYGMVELIRRVIPRDIVGGNIQKLRRMDALVHIFYEITGTAGAFSTALVLIPRFGTNYSFIVSPICFFLAGTVWYSIAIPSYYNLNTPSHDRALARTLEEEPGYIRATVLGFYLFFQSIWTGMRLVFTSRKFVWLLPGYAFALYCHRYLENGLAPIIARRYLGESAWAQIMVGGSNFGEMTGALSVFLTTNLVPTPMPWLRLEAILLLVPWYMYFWNPPKEVVKYAWMVGATMFPMSYGWAAGDVSLAAYIQASISRIEATNIQYQEVSPLSAVMGFLYSTYIIMYSILNPVLGQYVDTVFADTGGETKGGTVRPAVFHIAGTHFTIIGVIIFLATFVPRGSWSLNPEILSDQYLDYDFICEGAGDKTQDVKLESVPSVGLERGEEHGIGQAL